MKWARGGLFGHKVGKTWAQGGEVVGTRWGSRGQEAGYVGKRWGSCGQEEGYVGKRRAMWAMRGGCGLVVGRRWANPAWHHLGNRCTPQSVPRWAAKPGPGYQPKLEPDGPSDQPIYCASWVVSAWLTTARDRDGGRAERHRLHMIQNQIEQQPVPPPPFTN